LGYKGLGGHVKMEEVDENWAKQLAIYLWVCGHNVGSDGLVAIDYVTVDGRDKRVRIAEYRGTVGSTFQRCWMEEIKRVWASICAGDYLSVERREVLDHGISARTEAVLY
jgi:hypothetical protein